MATIMRYHGNNGNSSEGLNALADLSCEVSAASDDTTTQFLQHPVVNVEYDDDASGKHKGATIYLDPRDNGAVWYITFTMADVKKILKSLQEVK